MRGVQDVYGLWVMDNGLWSKVQDISEDILIEKMEKLN
jgi:hypothetical protein